MIDGNFGDEAYHLLVDMDGAESADADVAYVRRQRRLKGEPSMSLRRIDDGTARVPDAEQVHPSPLLEQAATRGRTSPSLNRTLDEIQCGPSR